LAEVVATAGLMLVIFSLAILVLYPRPRLLPVSPVGQRTGA
jgi:hypothetical protein